MSRVAITKVNDKSTSLPIFDEIARRFEAVKRRAFEFFEQRDRQAGHDLEDWLKAERELLGWPATELDEKNGIYELQIALPGFQSKDVEVTVTPKEIIVHAAAEHDKETKKGNVLWTEFGANDVYRCLETPKPVDVDKVTARLENGLLRIHAPEMTNPEAIPAKAA